MQLPVSLLWLTLGLAAVTGPLAWPAAKPAPVAKTATPSSPAASSAALRGTALVVDGDTLEVAGTRVRLSGIDAPETDQVCLDAAARPWSCGIAAREALASAIGSLAVACKPSGLDQYARTLAACRAADGRDLQDVMVRQGYALSFRHYSHAYDGAEDEARGRRQGLWAGAFVAPWDWRHRTPTTEVLGAASVPITARSLLLPPERAAIAGAQGGNAPDPACVIKGNVNRGGERIYHVPGQRQYAAVRIRPGDGKRWFCSENEARAAGWRKALR
jgi:endonuclease YncB( thermonuclease family)